MSIGVVIATTPILRIGIRDCFVKIMLRYCCVSVVLVVCLMYFRIVLDVLSHRCGQFDYLYWGVCVVYGCSPDCPFLGYKMTKAQTR